MKLSEIYDILIRISENLQKTLSVILEKQLFHSKI